MLVTVIFFHSCINVFAGVKSNFYIKSWDTFAVKTNRLPFMKLKLPYSEAHIQTVLFWLFWGRVVV